MSTFTSEDQRNCKMIAVLSMVQLLLTEIVDHKKPNFHAAAENAAKNFADLVVRTLELFDSPAEFKSEIKEFAESIGLQIEIAKCEEEATKQ